MFPEQINGEQAGPAADIYSTNVVLLEFLTGETPSRGEDTGSTLMKILREPTQRLSAYLPRYPL